MHTIIHFFSFWCRGLPHFLVLYASLIALLSAFYCLSYLVGAEPQTTAHTWFVTSLQCVLLDAANNLFAKSFEKLWWSA